MCELDLEKVEEPEINLTFVWIIEKARELRKMPTSASLTVLIPVWITKTGKILKRWEYQTTLPVS